MRCTGVLVVLMLVSAAAHGKTVWSGTSAQSVVDGGGDALATSGAVVTVSGQSTGEAAFLGAIASIDAHAFRGRELRFAGRLRVDDGPGSATLWVRADGPDGPVAFANTHDQPVRAGEGTRSRELRLYVPHASDRLRFGVTLGSAGAVYGDGLALTSDAVQDSGVSAYDVMARALSVMRSNALNADNVDWSAQAAAWLTDGHKQLPSQEAYHWLQKVVGALADRHTRMQTPTQASTYRAAAVASQPIQSRVMDDIGYLLVPGLSGTGAGDAAAFTAQLCRAIAALASTSTTGWIVDLRQNTGGNMHPMVNGLHTLLGDGELGASRHRSGRGRVWRSQASEECGLDLSRNRVAVLVGPRTASSGEAVAVAFRGRPDTRFFGQRTAGLATTNSTFPLPDGGALFLTTGVMVDRDGVDYPQGIVPEHAVPDAQDAIAAAAAWLRATP